MLELVCNRKLIERLLNAKTQERESVVGTGVFCFIHIHYHYFGGVPMQELLTVTGKPMSIGTGLRLPVVTYQAAVERAKREEVRLNHLLCKLISEGLETDPGEEVTR